jgi:hypothetical protein
MSKKHNFFYLKMYITDGNTKYFATGQQCVSLVTLNGIVCLQLQVGQQQYKRNALLPFHSNSDYAEAAHCYEMRTLPIILVKTGEKIYV